MKTIVLSGSDVKQALEEFVNKKLLVPHHVRIAVWTTKNAYGDGMPDIEVTCAQEVKGDTPEETNLDNKTNAERAADQPRAL